MVAPTIKINWAQICFTQHAVLRHCIWRNMSQLDGCTTHYRGAQELQRRAVQCQDCCELQYKWGAPKTMRQLECCEPLRFSVGRGASGAQRAKSPWISWPKLKGARTLNGGQREERRPISLAALELRTLARAATSRLSLVCVCFLRLVLVLYAIGSSLCEQASEWASARVSRHSLRREKSPKRASDRTS